MAISYCCATKNLFEVGFLSCELNFCCNLHTDDIYLMFYLVGGSNVEVITYKVTLNYLFVQKQ